MILADKIIALRKRAGWSQEELAQQLGVTRQSVSKWEGAQSVPDMDKVLQMSRLFGVSTDYLLKDELEETEVLAAEEPVLRRVTMEQASDYLALRRAAAPRVALATFLCVISPVTLLLLSGMSEDARFAVRGDAAAGLGLCALLVLVAAAVALFITSGAKSRAYEFLEKEPFETEYGVTGMVKERKQSFAPTATRLNVTGTVLCILSVVPLFACMGFRATDLAYIAAVCVLLLLVGLGCIAFVYAGVVTGAMDKLLEEGDYTRARKAKSGIITAVSVCYWLVTTAVFMIYTYGPRGNAQPQSSWIIWAVAGVLYGAVMLLLRTLLTGGYRREE